MPDLAANPQRRVARRPRLVPEKRRTHAQTIAFSDSELAVLDWLAAREGLARGNLVRALAVEQAMDAYAAHVQDQRDRERGRELREQGDVE